MSTFPCVVAVAALAMAVQVAPAAESPTPAEVRKAVARGLPYLEKEGEAWMKEKNCITCHQVPSMVWSFNTARRHKLEVDSDKVDFWNEWTVDNGLKRGLYYKVTDDGLKELASNGLTEDELKKLEPLKNKNFVFKEEFRAELVKALPAATLDKHEAIVFKTLGRAGQGGGGGGENNQYTHLLLSGAPAAVGNSAEVRKALVENLVKKQNKDGTWAAAPQFKAQQRPEAETLEVVTLWTVLALVDVPELSADGKSAVAKAREWLNKAATPVNVETVVLRALLAVQDGDKVKCEELTSELVKLQHEDGGWGWAKDRPTSDPFTTGLVLYGLSYLGHGGNEPQVRKAWQYLLQAQGDDGVWHIAGKTISANKKEDTKNSDFIYSYWATGWAVIGLLESLPQ